MPDLLVEGERVGLRLLELADPEPRPALDYAQLAGERREAQAAEEDRIVYVAMTRARERLLLSGAVDFTSWPRERPGAAPIAWLGPALAPSCRRCARRPCGRLGGCRLRGEAAARPVRRANPVSATSRGGGPPGAAAECRRDRRAAALPPEHAGGGTMNQPSPADGELFARARAGDARAREELVERYLPLARRLARRYQRSEEPLEIWCRSPRWAC